MNTYEIAGALLSQYLNELSATADARALTTYELIALTLQRNLRPQLSVTRERLAVESVRIIPAGRL